MYIEPNTTIRILKGVPLDPTYEHTIYFYTEQDQQDYFVSKTKFNLLRQYYQRANRGVMRVMKRAEDLYDCNYLMFQNASFGTKFFYAFITGIEYVNNEVSEISYQIDVMQTYHFDYELGQTFVEREHSETDVVGENLVPENLELGAYVSEDHVGTGYLRENSIVIAGPFYRSGNTPDSPYAPSYGGKYAGLFSGLHYTVFNDDTIDHTIPGNTPEASAVQFIRNAGQYQNQIVSMFYYPTAMLPPDNNQGDPVRKTVTIPKRQSGTIDGYTPKNNKLYTYPYNFLSVTNLQGSVAEFGYEFFFDGNGNPASNCVFYLSGDYSPNPTFWLYPKGYKSKIQYALDPYWGTFEEGMSIGGWGQLPWTVDSYKAWLAQNASSIMVNGLSSALGAFASNPGPVGLSSAVMTIPTALGKIEATRDKMPAQAHGSFAPMSQIAIDVLDFWFIPKHITAEFAEIIDNYFTKYGYACHKVKEPNRNSRPQFNYVKTINCIIHPLDAVGKGLPADDESRICRIYDNGITFWKNPANIGNYSVSNTPTP